MQDVAQQISVHWPDQCVNMIGHDHIMSERISLSVEMLQRFFDKSRDFQRSQPAFAHPGIEPMVESFRESFMVLGTLSDRMRLRVFNQPLREFLLPLVELGLRDRIRQPERHEVSRTILTPVRQMPGVNSHGRIGVERQRCATRMPSQAG